MKHKNDDKPNVQAYRERYARILELEEDALTVQEVTKTKSPLRGYLLLPVLAVVALGGWFFFKSPTARITPSAVLAPSPTDPLQAPTGSEPPALALKPQAGQPEPLISEPVVSPENAGKTAAQDLPQGAESAPVTPPFSEKFPQNTAEMSPGPAAPGTSLVVLLSTTSKEGAIARAKELGSRGVLCEVILSASGYYGVVLRRDSYEQAIASMNALIASGTVKNQPYIMSAGRVKAHIYPELR